MRKRRQFSRSADRPFRWNHRINAARERSAERFNHHRPHAAESFCEGVRAEQQHGPGFEFTERRAAAAGVTAHQVGLQRTNLVARNPRRSHLAETGVYSVGRSFRSHRAFDHGARCVNPFKRRQRERVFQRRRTLRRRARRASNRSPVSSIVAFISSRLSTVFVSPIPSIVFLKLSRSDGR